MSAHQTSPLKVAIIGAGQVADNVHASFYRTREEVQLVALNRRRRSQNATPSGTFSPMSPRCWQRCARMWSASARRTVFIMNM